MKSLIKSNKTMLSIEEATSFLKSHLQYLYLSVHSFLKSSSILRIIHLRYVSHVYFHTSSFIIIVSHNSLTFFFFIYLEHASFLLQIHCMIAISSESCYSRACFYSFSTLSMYFSFVHDQWIRFFFLNQTRLP